MKTPISIETFMKVACAVHAGVVVALWFAVFNFEVDVIHAKTWLVLALLWYPWMAQVVVKRGMERKYWLWVLCICLLFLLPTMSTQYTFVVWSLEGFAS